MTLRIKHLKGKFPEKVRCPHPEPTCDCQAYNAGQDSYAELEVGLDKEAIRCLLAEFTGIDAIRDKITDAIAASLKEILVIGTTNKKGE